MDTSTTQLIALTVVVFVFAANYITGLATRRRDLHQRPIEAYSALPALVSESVEASRPLHLSLGSATIGGESTLVALAGKDYLYYAVQQAAISDASPIITVSDAAAIPLAMDTLRRGYTSAQMIERYRPINVRWFPAGERSLAFAGGVMAMQGTDEDDVAANLLAGSFGVELALIMLAAQRRGKLVAAGSDRLDGIAITYALADYPILGEELFAAAGYLGDARSAEGRSARVRNYTVDALRGVVVVAILLLLLVSIVTELTA